MSVSEDTSTELDTASQTQDEAAEQYKPGRYADPTDDHIDYFNYVKNDGFLSTFFKAIFVNFGPNPDSNVEAAYERDMYFSVTGFKNSDPATDRRMQFASIADTNAPPPMGNADLSEKIAHVSNFSRGTGQALDKLYEDVDSRYSERLDGVSQEMRTNFSHVAATKVESAQTQPIENNHAPGFGSPVA